MRRSKVKVIEPFCGNIYVLYKDRKILCSPTHKTRKQLSVESAKTLNKHLDNIVNQQVYYSTNQTVEA